MTIRDFRGQSGAVYRYLEVDNASATPLGSGNYLYVRLLAKGPVVICAGEGEWLAKAIEDTWRKAAEEHGATHIYARRNVSGHIRRDELADLVAAHHPVMNAPAEEPSPSR
ncbi:MAG TPA: hypothetical protein VFE03_08385 [Caulobacteraceae bacterium]|nr:hypothetical protein [Caulobacteraceae bacterium]